MLTVEQFEQLSENDAVRYELRDRELVAMANAKFGHERVKFRITRSLMQYILAPSRVCILDVAFLNNVSAAQSDPEHIYKGAPDLAIEIDSESEKIQDYLNAGSKAVWAFYPKLRVVAVYRESNVQEYRGHEVLDASRADRPVRAGPPDPPV